MEDSALLRVELDHTRSKMRELVEQNTELVGLLEQLRGKLAEKKAQYLQKAAEAEALTQKLQEVSIEKALGAHEITFDGSEKDMSIMRLQRVESMLQGDVQSARQQLQTLQQCLLDQVQQRERAIRNKEEIQTQFQQLKLKLQTIHKEAEQTGAQLQEKRREVKLIKSQLKQIEETLNSKLTEKEDEIQQLLKQLHEATEKEEEQLKAISQHQKSIERTKRELNEKEKELQGMSREVSQLKTEKQENQKRYEKEIEDKDQGIKDMETELKELRTGVSLLKNECVRSQTAQRTLRAMQERVRQVGTTAVSCCRAVHENLKGYKAELDDMRDQVEKALRRYSEKERTRQEKVKEKDKDHKEQLKNISTTFTQQHAEQMAAHSKELKEFQTLIEQLEIQNQQLRERQQQQDQFSQFEAMKGQILKYKEEKEEQIAGLQEQIASLGDQHVEETEALRQELQHLQGQLGEKDAQLAQLQEHAQTSNALLAEQELRLAFLDGVATGSKNSPLKKEMPTPRASSFFSERDQNLSQYESQAVVRDRREIDSNAKERKNNEEIKKEKKKEKELKDALQVKDAVIRKLQNELSSKAETYSQLTHKNRVLSGEVARLSMSSAQSPVRESVHSTQLEALRKKKRDLEERMAAHTPKFKGIEKQIPQSPTRSVQFQNSGSFLSPRVGSLQELGEQIRQARLLRQSMSGRGGLSPSQSKLTVSQLSRA